MSINLVNAAYVSGLKGAKQAVLIVLADRANNYGYCYPGLNDIAKRAGISVRQAIRAVKQLEELGYLSVKRVQGDCNKYLLNMEKLSTTHDMASPEAHDMTSLPTRDMVSQTSDMVSCHPCHDVTLTTINHQEPKKRARENYKNQKPIRQNANAYRPCQPRPAQQVNREHGKSEIKHIRDLIGAGVKQARGSGYRQIIQK